MQEVTIFTKFHLIWCLSCKYLLQPLNVSFLVREKEPTQQWQRLLKQLMRRLAQELSSYVVVLYMDQKHKALGFLQHYNKTRVVQDIKCTKMVVDNKLRKVQNSMWKVSYNSFSPSLWRALGIVPLSWFPLKFLFKQPWPEVDLKSIRKYVWENLHDRQWFHVA